MLRICIKSTNFLELNSFAFEVAEMIKNMEIMAKNLYFCPFRSYIWTSIGSNLIKMSFLHQSWRNFKYQHKASKFNRMLKFYPEFVEGGTKFRNIENSDSLFFISNCASFSCTNLNDLQNLLLGSTWKSIHFRILWLLLLFYFLNKLIL